MGSMKTHLFDYADISSPMTSAELTVNEDRYDSDALALSVDQFKWINDGYVVLKNFIPESLILRYRECWLRENVANPDFIVPRYSGWPDCTPYMRHDEIKDLCLYRPLAAKLKELIGFECGIHLNLTGWKSTQRDWHSDHYLNPASVGTRYAAIWIALENIDPDSGPFELVPGSHRWPTIRQDLMFRHYPQSLITDPRWPWITQNDIAGICEREIIRRRATVTKYLPKRGDVLIWHSGLLHRGSRPNDPGIQRPAFIGHFSSIWHRPDFPAAKQWKGGGFYFPIAESGPV